MWFFKWWQWWFLFFIPLNVGMTLTKKPQEAAPPAQASASSDSESSEPKVLDYRSSFDTILKDLVTNWQSPITYLKSRGYLTKDLEQAAQDRLKSINVVTPLTVEKPQLLIKAQKINKKKHHKRRRFAMSKSVTESPQNEIQREEQLIRQKDDEPVKDLEANLDTENAEDLEENDSESENSTDEEMKPSVSEDTENENNVVLPPVPSSNNPSLSNLERSGKAIKNQSPSILIWDGKNGSKMVPINRPTIVHWNNNRQLHPSKQRIYNWDGDYARKNSKFVPGFMPEKVIWDGDKIDGSNRKDIPRRTNDWSDELYNMPSMYRWDSEHNRLLFRNPTNDYIDGLVKNFSNRKRIDLDNWKK